MRGFPVAGLVLCFGELGYDEYGCPNPAARSVDSSGPRPAQQPASVPSMTTAGTDRIPSCLARAITPASFMSSTLTSHDGQAMARTRLMVSSHAGQPALNTSIRRVLLISIPHICPPSPTSFLENSILLLVREGFNGDKNESRGCAASHL